VSSKNWTLVAAVFGSSIVFLDSAVLNVALPAIGREPRLFLDVLEAQNYIVYGYLLSLSALLILAGALSDYFGRRRMFLIGLAGFGGASVLCGLAPNLELLVVFRLIQGAAGALLVPGSLAIVSNNFEGEEQGRAFGIWAAASGAAPILGPFVGGLLVDNLSWRFIFLLNLPFTIVAIWAGLRYVKESRDERASGHFDWIGAFLVAVAVGGLSFGTIFGQQRQWQDPVAFVALAVGALTTIALPFYFARAKFPLVPLSMFRSRNFTVTNVSTLLIYGSLYVTFFFVPLFLQGTLGYNASAVGLGSIPGSLFLIFLSTRFGALASRYGPRIFMTTGPLIMGAGLLWAARMPPTSTPWQFEIGNPSTWVPSIGYFTDLLPYYLVFGVGVSIMVAPLTTALMRSVPGRQAGLASAINNAISRVGPQLAGALIFIVVTASFYATLGNLVPGLDTSSPDVRAQLPPINRPADSTPPDVVNAARSASGDAFHLAMLSAAGLMLAGALTNGLFISNGQALSAPSDASPSDGASSDGASSDARPVPVGD
jgi:EmrB/QacA subfamily drug resistance transporter